VSDKPKVYWDSRGDQTNEITAYFHCQKCLDEWKDGVEGSRGLSPGEYARTQAGLTGNGSIQVWCNRHNQNVMILSFQPRKGLEYPQE
jgi:hypothetical protein